ncbi:MAG: tetratricopeptide repeat protein [Bacteroidales bacterium]|nr:tetratricopeptide repeat protein [Bacteroidales bacterium]
MTGKPSRLKVFFAELKRRGVARVATVYTVVGIGVIEISDIIGGRFAFPEWTVQLIIILVIVGFPVAVILGWIFDITSRGIERTEALTLQEQSSLPSFTWRPSWVSVIMFILLIALTVTYCTVPRPNALGFKKQGWIIISDLDNSTGDEIFDNSLVQALSVTVDQSKYISVFPQTQVEEVLARMRMDSDKKVTPAIALEIAQRENIKAVLSMAIARVGDTYLISTNLLNPETGETIRSRSVTVRGKSDILTEMNRLALKVRKDLGEALNEIHLHTVPLHKATTSSLEALKCATEGTIAWSDGQQDEGRRLLMEAIKLDPEFAYAHTQLGSLYYWTNQRDRGEEHFEKALLFADRLTEREKLEIEARIERFRGKYEEAVVKYRIFLKKYPNVSHAWFGMGYCFMMLKRYEEAIDTFKKSLEVNNQKDPNAYINIATSYAALHNYQQSIYYYLEAFEINPDMLTVTNINHEFGFTYVKMGETDKAREVFAKLMEGNDEQKGMGLRLMALLSMYEGKLSEAITFLNESSICYSLSGYRLSMLRDDLLLAVVYRTKGMEHKYDSKLNELYTVINEVSTEPFWHMLLGNLCARSGDIEKAESILNSLSEKINEGNRNDEAAYYQLKGEIEMAKGNHDEAVKLLETTIKLRKDAYTLSSLAYSYKSSGQLGKAIATYQDIIGPYYDLGWEAQQCTLEAFYNMARIYEELGNKEQAEKYYRQFVDIWKNADEDIPILQDAKERLATLETVLP